MTKNTHLKQEIKTKLDTHSFSINEAGRNLFKELLGYLCFAKNGLSKDDLKLLLGEWEKLGDIGKEDAALSDYHFSQLTHPIKDYILQTPDGWFIKEKQAKDYIIQHIFNTSIDKQNIEDQLNRFFLFKEEYEQHRHTETLKKIYVYRKDYSRLLYIHTESNNKPPLVITGTAGCGKTTLLANWAEAYQKNHPDDLVITHFAGTTSHSTNWKKVVVRITEILKNTLSIKINISEDEATLKTTLTKAFQKASQIKKVIVIIDGIDCVKENGSDTWLTWLPFKLPDNITLIVSSSENDTLEVLKKRDWRVTKLNPLSISQKEKILNRFIEYYSVTVDLSLRKAVLSHSSTNNPLFLNTILNEIRFSEGDSRKHIDTLLDCKDLKEMFQTLLTYNSPDNRDVSPLFLSLLYGSKRGLSKEELSEIFIHENIRLTRVKWKKLLDKNNPYIINQSGCYTFLNEAIKAAVAKTYFKDTEYKKQIHQTLSNYFMNQPLTIRKAEELPEHLNHLENYETLFTILSDPAFFSTCWQLNKYKAMEYWSLIETHTSHTKVEAFQHAEKNIKIQTEWLDDIERLFIYCGQFKDALPIREFLTKHYKNGLDKTLYLKSLRFLGKVHSNLGNNDIALQYYNQCKELSIQLDDKNEYQSALNNIGIIKKVKGDYEGAMAMYREQEKVCRSIDEKTSLIYCLANQSSYYEDKGDIATSLKLINESEKLCYETGLLDGLIFVLNKKGSTLYSASRMHEAESMFKKVTELSQRIGDYDMMANGLMNQGAVRDSLNDSDKALELYQKAEEICEKYNYINQLKNIYFNQALVCYEKNDLDSALEKHELEESACKKCDDKTRLARSWAYQGRIYLEKGELIDGRQLTLDAEMILKNIGNSWEKRRTLNVISNNKHMHPELF